MGLNHSPSIVTNGLVFAYDMGNTQKSWKGAPTTNLLSSPSDFTSGNWIKTMNSGTVPSVVTETILDRNGNLRAVDKLTLPSDGTYPRIYQSWTPASTATNTFSIWLKSAGGPAICEILAFRNSPWALTSMITANLTQNWQKYTLSFSPLDTTSHQIYIGSHDNAKGAVVYLDDAHLEVGTFATPFVNGTRSNTQAIIDLTGNNTITASSLTYNTDNSFKFDGTSNFLNCGSNSAINLTTEISIECWFNAELISPGGGIVTYASSGVEQYALWATENKIMFSTSWPSPWQLAYSNTISINTWYHAVATFKNGAWKIYKNGVLDTSGTFAITSFPVSNGYLVIGNNHPGGQEYFKGQIPVAKIYNRELSEAEVKQNFNALRGRFGI